MLEKLKELIGGAQLMSATTAAKKKPYTGKYPDVSKIKRGYFKKGDKGAEITNLQNYLNWYTDGAFFKKYGKASGVYDNGTFAYTKKMQTAFFGAKEADGLVGKKTVSKMKAYSNSFKPTKKGYPGNYPNVNRAQKLVDEAIRLAWPSGTSSSRYKWNGGSATAAFSAALDKAYPEHNSWGPAPSKGCSCDVFVGTVVRSSGIDTRFPRGLDEQETHTPTGMVKYVLYNADMYKQSAFGDIIWYDYSGPGGHVLIRGKNCIYQAGYQSTYGHTTDGHGEIKDVEPKVIIFRPKNYLQKGDTGVEVKRLQSYLNWYTNGEFYKKCGKADGIYGNNTLKYVKKMQTDFFGAKEADGLVGAKTIERMKKVKK